MKTDKKPRRTPRWGVRRGYQAHCACGWRSGTHLGRGAAKDAHADVHDHREACPKGGLTPETTPA
jgi:hypothetical protein